MNGQIKRNKSTIVWNLAMATGVVAPHRARLHDGMRSLALAPLAIVLVVILVLTNDNAWRGNVEAQSNSPPAEHLATCQMQIKQTSGSQPGLSGELANDCAWLLSMQTTLEGVDNDVLNWGTATPLAQWNAVAVDTSGQRVIGFDVFASTGVNLRGQLPANIGKLTALQVLRFQPYGNLKSTIPELGHLKDLRLLHISGVHASGRIPQWVADLTTQKLASITLHSNQLTGPIPTPTPPKAPTALERLRLSGNKLTGTIPESLCSAPDLETLSLGNNQLSGSIPKCLEDLSKLSYLELRRNQLSGSIPSELGKLTKLRGLALEHNRLTGGIPSEIGDMSALESLDLARNQLTGSIPPKLGSLSKLQTLKLDHNNLTGTIPKKLGELAELRFLLLVGNQLSGTIPVELGTLRNLTWLHLSNNQLSGSIPNELSDLNFLESLFLGGNRLEGEIPSALGNLRNISSLDLSDNDLSGSIPLELGEFSRIGLIRLNNNRLEGPIPQKLPNIPGLYDLHLHNNNLTEPIPLKLEGNFSTARFFSLRLDMEQIPGGGLNLRSGAGALSGAGELPVHVGFDGDKIPEGADRKTSWLAIENENYIHLDPLLLHEILPADTHRYHDHYQEWEIAHKTTQPFGFDVTKGHWAHVYVSLRAHDASGGPVFGDLASPAIVCIGHNNYLPAGSYLTLIHYIDHESGWHPVHRPATVPADFTDDDACGEVDDISGYSVFARGIGTRPPVNQPLNASGDTSVVVRIGDTTVYVHVPAGAAPASSRLAIAGSGSVDRPIDAYGETVSSDRTLVAVDITDANGQDVTTLASPATVCMTAPAAQKEDQGMYHLGDRLSSQWERLTPPATSTLPIGYREDFACGLTRELSKFVTGTTANIGIPKISRITPQVRAVTVSPGDRVRLGVDVYGMQDILDNSLGNGVSFEWSVAPSGPSIEEDNAGYDDDSVADEREVIFTAPSSPGRYVLRATLDSWECKYGDGNSNGCDVEIEVVVQRPRAVSSPDATPADPAGEIPSILTDADGNQYEVFTPVGGGTFIGEDVTLSAEPGAVPNGEIIGVRAQVDGEASNVGQTHHRMTLAGSYYSVSAVNASGESLNMYLFDDPIEVCFPLPSRLSSRISDVAMVSARHEGTMTVLSSKVRLVETGVELCGALSQLPARLAAGHLGSPSALPTAVPDAAPEAPETGGASPTASGILWMILLSAAAFAIAGLIVMSKRRV